MSREDRREQLLDASAVFVLEHGLNALTMDALADHAGVSKQLLYKYFDTRLILLQELLIREDEKMQSEIIAALEQVERIEDVLRAVVSKNFDQKAGGNVLRVLRDAPDIKEVLSRLKETRTHKVGYYLLGMVKEQYQLPEVDARAVLQMASAASFRAAGHYAQHGGDREAQIDRTVRFILSAFEGYARQ